MRTNEPTDSGEKFRPLGDKVVKPAPEPSHVGSKPAGPSGIVQDADGRMQTTSHKPHATLDEVIRHWLDHYTSDTQTDFLP